MNEWIDQCTAGVAYNNFYRAILCVSVVFVLSGVTCLSIRLSVCVFLYPDQGLYSRKLVNGGRWYDDPTLSVRPGTLLSVPGVRPTIAIHKRNRTYDPRKFVRKFTTYLQLSYSES